MKTWSEKNTVEKVATVISAIAFGVWFILNLLEETGVLTGMDVVNYAAILTICVSEAVNYWNQKRIISYIAIAGILCMVAVFVLYAL